jgi:hypothetical protein
MLLERAPLGQSQLIREKVLQRHAKQIRNHLEIKDLAETHIIKPNAGSAGKRPFVEIGRHASSPFRGEDTIRRSFGDPTGAGRPDRTRPIVPADTRTVHERASPTAVRSG